MCKPRAPQRPRVDGCWRSGTSNWKNVSRHPGDRCRGTPKGRQNWMGQEPRTLFRGDTRRGGNGTERAQPKRAKQKSSMLSLRRRYLLPPTPRVNSPPRTCPAPPSAGSAHRDLLHPPTGTDSAPPDAGSTYLCSCTRLPVRRLRPSRHRLRPPRPPSPSSQRRLRPSRRRLRPPLLLHPPPGTDSASPKPAPPISASCIRLPALAPPTSAPFILSVLTPPSRHRLRPTRPPSFSQRRLRPFRHRLRSSLHRLPRGPPSHSLL